MTNYCYPIEKKSCNIKKQTQNTIYIYIKQSKTLSPKLFQGNNKRKPTGHQFVSSGTSTKKQKNSTTK